MSAAAAPTPVPAAADLRQRRFQLPLISAAGSDGSTHIDVGRTLRRQQSYACTTLTPVSSTETREPSSVTGGGARAAGGVVDMGNRWRSRVRRSAAKRVHLPVRGVIHNVHRMQSPSPGPPTPFTATSCQTKPDQPGEPLTYRLLQVQRSLSQGRHTSAATCPPKRDTSNPTTSWPARKLRWASGTGAGHRWRRSLA